MNEPDPKPPSSAAPILLAIVAVTALVGVSFFLFRAPPASPETPAVPVTEHTSGRPAAAAPHAPLAPLPKPEESDARITRLLAALSNSPLFARWLRTGDLLDRIVVAAINVSEAESPRKHLSFLRPTKPFEVRASGERTTIAPASFARYDAICDVLDGIDMTRAAAVYKELKPLLDAAYSNTGYPGGNFDSAVASALTRILGIPIHLGDIDVVRDGATFRFTDPLLEARPPADKHLLRLGTRNLEIVQRKALELKKALGFK